MRGSCYAGCLSTTAQTFEKKPQIAADKMACGGLTYGKRSLKVSYDFCARRMLNFKHMCDTRAFGCLAMG